MIRYFDRRRKEQAERDADYEQAKAALALSLARSGDVEPRREQISDLVSRLRAIQTENHYSVRLLAAFGQK